MAFEGLQGLSALQDCQYSVRGSGETAKRRDDFSPEAAGPVMKRYEQREGGRDLTCHGGALAFTGEDKRRLCWSSDFSQARNLRSTHKLKMRSRNTERRHASRKHYLLKLRSDFFIEGEAPEKKPCTQRE